MQFLPTIAKKHREGYLLQAFLRLSGINAQIVEADGEAPDFILGLDSRRIGLEITEIFVESDNGAIQPRARESIGRRIADQAHQRYEQLGGKPVHVTIGLSLGAELRDLNRSETAERLANFILALDPSPDQYIAWHPPSLNNPLPSEVHYLHILAVPSWNMAHWYVPSSGWVAPLTAEILQASIDEKSNKLEQYRLAAPESWLLVAIEGWSASQLFDRLSEVRPEALQSPFDRTYFLSAFDGFLRQLAHRHDA
jgi:hypothetical protein